MSVALHSALLPVWQPSQLSLVPACNHLKIFLSELRLTCCCDAQHLQGSSEEDSEGSMSGDDSEGTPDPLASDDEMEGESESQSDDDPVRAQWESA